MTIPAKQERVDLSAVGPNRFRSTQDYLRAIEDVADRVEDLTKIFQSVRRVIASQIFELGPTSIDPKNSPKAAPVKTLQKLIPQMNKLQKEFDVVTGLHAALEELDQIEADMTVRFNPTGNKELIGAAQRAAKELNNVRTKTLNALSNAYKFLNQLGSSTVPKDFSEFTEVISKSVSTLIEYRSVESFLYVIPQGNVFVFVNYLHLKDLKDESGRFYPEMNIVVSCAMKPEGKEYRITLTNKFSAPGSFPFGKQVANVKDAIKVLGFLLDLENFDNQFNRVPLSQILNENAIQKQSFSIDTMVKDIRPEEDMLEFTFKSGVKNREHAQRLAGQLHAQLQTFMRRTNARLRMRIGEHPNKKGFYVAFYFTREPGQGVIPEDLSFLKDRFKLSTPTVERIASLINNE